MYVRMYVCMYVCTYVVVDINPCVRFTRYEAGGHFSWHHDGSFVYDTENRSVFTVMVYLNGGFSGGATKVVFCWLRVLGFFVLV